MKGGGGQENMTSTPSSQVFVFSTMLANKAAEAVLNGSLNSILSYHLEEPDTKWFIEVTAVPVWHHPLPAPSTGSRFMLDVGSLSVSNLTPLSYVVIVV